MTEIKTKLTDEERRKRHNEYNKEWLKRKKEKEALLKAAGDCPNYENMYITECAKNKALENKIADLENICKTYAIKEKQATEALNRSTLEYNARIKYMLECVRHALISMQFAMNAPDSKQGGEQ